MNRKQRPTKPNSPIILEPKVAPSYIFNPPPPTETNFAKK